jgi:hypothetical protein
MHGTRGASLSDESMKTITTTKEVATPAALTAWSTQQRPRDGSYTTPGALLRA